MVKKINTLKLDIDVFSSSCYLNYITSFFKMAPDAWSINLNFVSYQIEVSMSQYPNEWSKLIDMDEKWMVNHNILFNHSKIICIILRGMIFYYFLNTFDFSIKSKKMFCCLGLLQQFNLIPILIHEHDPILTMGYWCLRTLKLRSYFFL